MISMAKALSKLTITAYVDRERKHKISEMSAMYNPESLILAYSNDYLPLKPINIDGVITNYVNRKLGNLSLDLLFDAQLPGNDTRALDQRLADLRALCSAIDSTTGEAHFLRLTWGQMKWDGEGYFAGRLEKMTIQYSLFDRNGAPLRATASLTLLADDSLQIQQSKLGRTAPPASLARLPPGDHLPMLEDNPGRLARRNDLDSFYSGRGKQLAIEAGPSGRGRQLAIEFNSSWRNLG